MTEDKSSVAEFKVKFFFEGEGPRSAEESLDTSDVTNAGLRLLTVCKNFGGVTTLSFRCLAANDDHAWNQFEQRFGGERKEMGLPID